MESSTSSCIVPYCSSKMSNIDKLFIILPVLKHILNHWLSIIIQETNVNINFFDDIKSSVNNFYICEDHFSVSDISLVLFCNIHPYLL